MPAFVISSVDTTANTLTSTGVAAAGQPLGTVLQTGDRFRVRNTGGALPAATPALASTTDYFAIRVSDNVIKIADTNAHALAGTGIVDLTGAGSGTTTIEFGLPYCLPTVVMAHGVQIPSVGLQGSWAALVALYNLLTGQAQSVFSNLNLAIPGVMSATDVGHSDTTDTILGCDFVATSGTVSYVDTGRILTTSAATIVARLPLKAGDRLKSITALIGGDGSVDMTSMTVNVNTAGVPSSIGSGSSNNITSTDFPIDVTDTKLTAGQAVVVKIVVNASLFSLDNVRYTFDRPVP